MITDYNDNLKAIFEKYGKVAQEQKLIEECSELIRAIARKDTNNFIEELADVQVLIDQFLLKYPQLYKTVAELKKIKAERTVQRMTENNEK